MSLPRGQGGQEDMRRTHGHKCGYRTAGAHQGHRAHKPGTKTTGGHQKEKEDHMDHKDLSKDIFIIGTSDMLIKKHV